MDIMDFKAGSYRKGYKYRYFLPEKINHSFFWTDEVINELLEKASLKLGELNSFSRFVPDTDMFIIMHILKEAVVSSRIEGTRTKIEEALIEENEIEPERRDDWKEVNNYVNAMNTAIKELKTLPLSNRLIKNTHKILLSSGRGGRKNPGEFRRSQNWIGGASLEDAVFIPPAHTELPELMSDLEFFLHNFEIKVPHLVKIAIAHYQFETIHRFWTVMGYRDLYQMRNFYLKIMKKKLQVRHQFRQLRMCWRNENSVLETCPANPVLGSSKFTRIFTSPPTAGKEYFVGVFDKPV